jgi:hypothetical protein
LKIILATLLLILIIELVIYLLVKKISLSKWILTKDRLVDKYRFNKFKIKNYNEYLGWDKKSNSKDYDITNNRKVSYSISKKGFRKTKFHRYENTIATFGDSYTFCRESSDNNTWQEQLSKKQKKFVSNYGVGNYGLDQAYLKFKKTKLKSDTKVVIFGIVPETICRIQSVWKNYLEFGNTNGFKPYCILRGKKLVIKKNLLKNNHEYNDLAIIISKIKKIDRFYSDKYTKHQLIFPYSFHFLKNFYFNLQIVRIFFSLFLRKKTNKKNMDKKFFPQVMKSNILNSHRLYNEFYSKHLLGSLLNHINNDVIKNKKKCIFVFFPQLFDLKLHTRVHYQTFLHKHKNKLNIIDLTNEFLDIKSYKKYFISDKYGGHLNNKGNKFVATILNNILNNERNL